MVVVALSHLRSIEVLVWDAYFEFWEGQNTWVVRLLGGKDVDLHEVFRNPIESQGDVFYFFRSLFIFSVFIFTHSFANGLKLRTVTGLFYHNDLK